MEAITRISITKQIVESIKEEIHKGEFKPGQKLPAEISLSKQLKVSRSSVREVLYQLQAEGYIELKPGKGAFVLSSKPTEPLKAIRDWFITAAPTLENYMEVREGINPLAAELACERSSEAEISELKTIHHKFTEANLDNDIPNLVLLDEQFHSQIMKMSHNALLAKISYLMAKGLKQYRLMSITAKGNSNSTVEEHSKILAAIINRNKEEANTAMMSHLTKAREGILAVTSEKKGVN